MDRCDACGAPLVRTWSENGGWAARCPCCRAARPCAGANGEREAGALAATGLGWYALEAAADDALDRAEAAFHQARQASPCDLALGWMELLARFGARLMRVGSDEAWLLHRRTPPGQPLSEDADFIRLMNAAAGSDALAYFQREGGRIDGTLSRALKLGAGKDCEVFIALRTEDAGSPTPERRLCDAVYDRLTGERGVGRVFYAPRSLSGRTQDEFEAILYHSLSTARVLLVAASSRTHADAPWVRAEWLRYLAWGRGRTLVCRVDGLEQEALPEGLSACPGVGAGEADSVAEQVCRMLALPARTPPPEQPEALFRRGQELLPALPEKAVALLRRAAEEKHIQALCLLGRCFEKGLGVKADAAEARRCYLTAAGRGSREARTALDAMRLRKEAERGSTAARSALGALLVNRWTGTAPFPEEAARWLDLAAGQGDVQAQYLYGCMLMEGVGVAQDRRLGRRLLLSAQKRGSQEADRYLRDGRPPWNTPV